MSDYTTEELANEIWKPVPRYEKDYSVSNLGRVRRDGAGFGATPGRLLKPRENSSGYLVATLCVNDTRRIFTVHLLVASAFIGPRPDDHQINHKDGDKMNNRPYNLEYVTPLENGRHASMMRLRPFGDRNGSRTCPESRPRGDQHWLRKHPERIKHGEDNGNAKLTEEQVREIRRASGTHVSVACAYGVSANMVSAIRRGLFWKHIT